MWSNNNFLWGPPRELVHKISGLAPLESRMCLEQQNFPKTIEDEAVATTALHTHQITVGRAHFWLKQTVLCAHLLLYICS